MSQPPPLRTWAVGAVGAVPNQLEFSVTPNSDLSYRTATPTPNYYGYRPTTDSANPTGIAVAAQITPNADKDIILDEKWFFRGNWYKAMSSKWTNPAVFYHLINTAAEKDLPDTTLISLAKNIQQVVVAGWGKFWKRTSSHGYQLLLDPTNDICATIRKIRDHRRILEENVELARPPQQRVHLHPSSHSAPHNATTAGAPHDLTTLVNMYVKQLIAVNGESYHATHDTVVRSTIVAAIHKQMEEKGIQFVRHLEDGSCQILGGTEQIISFFLMLEKDSKEATHRALTQNASNSQTIQQPNGTAPQGVPLDVFVKKLISGYREHFHTTQDNTERHAIVKAIQKQIEEKGARFVSRLEDGSYQILGDEEQIIEFFLNLDEVPKGKQQSSESTPTQDRKPAPKEAERPHDDGNRERNKLSRSRVLGHGAPERVGQSALAKRKQAEAKKRPSVDP